MMDLFPKYIVVAGRLFRVGILRVNTDRAFRRDLVDFEVQLDDPLSEFHERTFIGITLELKVDFPEFRLPVPLQWLMARFLASHVMAGDIKNLRSDTGPVLTTATYAGYLGETIGSDDADQIVVRVLQACLRGGVREPVTLSVLFASTNLDIASLRGSINALEAQHYLSVAKDDAYDIDAPRVLSLRQPIPARRMEPSPVSRYYQEVDIEADQPFCFAIMPLKDCEFPQARYFEVIKPLLSQELGIKCYRVDEDTFPDRIDNKIYTYMVRSQFVVAEVSTRNPNVMYELGLAHALNKRCILLTQRSPQDLPFDVSRIAVEPYTDDEALRSYLRRVVTALLGKEEAGTSPNPQQAAMLLPG